MNEYQSLTCKRVCLKNKKTIHVCLQNWNRQMCVFIPSSLKERSSVWSRNTLWYLPPCKTSSVVSRSLSLAPGRLLAQTSANCLTRWSEKLNKIVSVRNEKISPWCSLCAFIKLPLSVCWTGCRRVLLSLMRIVEMNSIYKALYGIFKFCIDI